ncbi:MAG TPA: hemerythrin domain-containing protein, partial [Arthrobacter sp.]|nr:hemerythrin domain-containing protein [Arthrobacter sp.]
MDITDVILNDHHDQRRMFAILEEMRGESAEDLAAVWQRLHILLEVHAKAEEELFYPELLALGKGEGGKDSAEDETTDAIHDHNEIRDAI